MKVRFMGTGTSVGVPMIGCRCSVCLSSDPRNHRTRSSIAICSDRASVIIDTPPEFRLQVLRAGITRLDGILFTHLHADHIFGFDDIRRFNQLQGEPLPVYGAPETIEGIRRVFRYAFEPPQQPGTSMPAVRTCAVEGPFQVGDLRFTPVPVLHGRLPVTGYRVGSFAYLTDCSEIPAASLPLLEGVETLVLGALRPTPHPTHFSIPEALAAIARLKPRRAYLTHLSHEVDHETVERTLPPNVFLAYDGLELEI